jgi:hypothetical protein
MASAQAYMDRRTPIYEVEDHFTVLPAELLVIIAEQLPVREMCRLRSVNRHFSKHVELSIAFITRRLGFSSTVAARLNEDDKPSTPYPQFSQ